jgi:hypothetical protein
VLSFPINGPDSLLVFSPHITSPRKGAKWPIGSVQNITWETSNIPAEKHNSTTQILLGYIADNSENLNVRKFPLR